MNLRSASKLIVPLLILFFGAGSASADPSTPELEKFLPAKIGTFRRLGAIRQLRTLLNEGVVKPDTFEPGEARNPGLFSGEAEYIAGDGKRLLAELITFQKDSDAYSLLTILASAMRDGTAAENSVLNTEVGTASARSADRIVFFKGPTLVRISSQDPNGPGDLPELGRLFAEKLNPGEGEIPVLVMHLPDWENARKRVLYFSGFTALQSVAPDQSILASLDSVRDADAVVAQYGQAKLIIVEFNTPQIAGENDRQIVSKIQQLRSQNQPTPTSYRRVGNYSVFVFNASSEQAASELIDQIKYEQVVRWLGDNPYWLKEAQRRYTETTLGVLVAVVKASGLTLVGCFGLGGLIGAILFARRRTRQAKSETFSDAGGMLRLNLDDMTPQTDPARLLPGQN
ncbi:MAG TPA: DUF6599 family protein [Pyrinomonadaceae bacterium]|nr:DUF6599 family protein [Pyrinomonadaceae bacterium]